MYATPVLPQEQNRQKALLSRSLCSSVHRPTMNKWVNKNSRERQVLNRMSLPRLVLKAICNGKILPKGRGKNPGLRPRFQSWPWLALQPWASSFLTLILRACLENERVQWALSARMCGLAEVAIVSRCGRWLCSHSLGSPPIPYPYHTSVSV